MVRVAAMRDAINTGLVGHIRRVYPAIQGPRRWGNIIEKRTKYLEETFPLTQEPLIEAIPQYEPGENSSPEDFLKWNGIDGSPLSEVQKKRLAGLSEILQLNKVNYNLYPHQKEAILGHLEDRDVVVATGTGSGKTESFLYPIVTHLHDEALRLIEDGEEKSDRAIKAIILYPMNALVADQMSRLRELFGDPKTATHFLNNGYGRFPQFGMYTGRTPFHGWFAKPNSDGKYERVKKVENRIGKVVKHYERLKHDTRVWDALVERNKIPSVGGRIELAEPGDTNSIPFEKLPGLVKQNLLNKKELNGEKLTLEIDEITNSRFKLIQNEEVFSRFKKSDMPLQRKDGSSKQKNPVHLRFMGDCLDRELISRHQMHLGGVRQYIEEKWDQKTDTTQEVIDKIGVGIPDIMVTNYSMLEYMLMRPLEHVFWHETKEWLDGCERAKKDPKDPMRRKLLLVVDEAHLYQGAMGTEFSLLLNRLLSVLSGDSEKLGRDRIQFIITSASLGSDIEEAKKYSAGLLSLEDDRKERMWIPASRRLELTKETEEGVKINDELKKILADGFKKLESKSREDVEQWLLEQIFDNVEDIKSQVDSAFPEEKEDTKLKHRVQLHMESWNHAHRLRRLLLRSDTLHEIDGAKKELEIAIDYSGIPKDIHLADNIPRRAKLIRHYMFENPEGNQCKDALDMLLDLIASARLIGSRKPFLPMRMHLFFRGDTVSRICISCGEISSAGVGRCTDPECSALNYELMIDRNCGGTFVKLWCDSEITEENMHPDATTPNLSDLGKISRVWQSRNYDPDIGKDSFIGVFARVLDDEDEVNSSKRFYLNKYSGTMEGHKFPPEQSELHNYVKIEIILPNSGLQKKRWEKNGGYIEPRICPYCNENFSQKQTRQFSDTETRGDQFFLEAIANATSNLDPVEDSPHAHKGRKMLLFSDGRQRAANLAMDLKNAQATDQGRAMFVYLHKQEWFQKIPEKSRTLHKLYPYLCLFSGLARNNPLTDSGNKPDRSRMISHTVLLTSSILCKFHDQIDALSEIYEECKPDEIEKSSQDFIRKRIFRYITRTTNEYLRDNSEKDWIKEHKKSLREAFKKAKDSFKRENLDWKDLAKKISRGKDKFPDNLKKCLGDLPELKKIPDHTEFAYLKLISYCTRLRNLVRYPEDRLIPHIVRTNILENPGVKEFDVCQRTAEIIIEKMKEDDSFIQKVAKLCGNWSTSVLPFDTYSTPPSSMGSLVLKWCSDGLFGVQSLGLGELCLLKSDNSEFESEEWNLISSSLPLLFCDYGSYDNRDESTKRSICNEKGTISYGSIYDSFKSFPPKVMTSDNNKDDFIIILKQGLYNIIQTDDEDVQDTIEEVSEKIVEQTNTNGDKLLYRKELNEKHKFLLDSDRVIFKPISETLDLEFKGKTIQCPQYYCSSCLNHRPKSQHNFPCPRCGDRKIIDTGDKSESNKKNRERALGYFEERLLPWHRTIADFDDEPTLAVYRAEEHTAQISTKKNEEDANTLTEEYELMFQDVPIQSYDASLEERIEQPPIDILSSTTTMEVGIDLGDLNAVALRTVPPHASNYQQRVGRAGRGSSEVSMALTWIDNSAYAQSNFERPESLVSHPSEPPRLYLNNEKIRHRHVNALLFQRFFKRENYDPETLSFENMTVTDGSLLESLGSIANFVHDMPAEYGKTKFLDYIDTVKREISENKLSTNSKMIIESTGARPELIIEVVDRLKKHVDSWNIDDFEVEEE